MVLVPEFSNGHFPDCLRRNIDGQQSLAWIEFAQLSQYLCRLL